MVLTDVYVSACVLAGKFFSCFISSQGELIG